MMEVNREELAWAGGFFEGEGNFHFDISNKDSRSPRVRLSLSQVNKEPLDRFVRALGFGSVSGPYVRKDRNHQPYYTVVLRRWELVQAAVAMLWPWLSRKRKDQAKTMLLRYEQYRK
jgi:hypothetical protein